MTKPAAPSLFSSYFQENKPVLLVPVLLRCPMLCLAAAAHEMARSGFHGMSMRDLARATGRGSSFYTHFRSKEDILFALHVEAFDALIVGAERTSRPPTTRRIGCTPSCSITSATSKNTTI